eukprot:Anaeramoba_ignava/a482576_7.p1 GENE.a482576_7~~a482576_7.p1  ORF type:complete len:172 (+),score=19.21 a482576_7:464-979(+)
MGHIAFQYAEALFASAIEEDNVENVKSEFETFVEAQDENVYKFLNHPKIKKQDKKEIINKVVQNSILKHFVYVLIDNNRVELLTECLTEYSKIVDHQNQVMKVTVYSGKELTVSDLNKLKNNLAMKHNRTVNISNIIDHTIIGGLRIEYEGMILDETINNHLNKLKNNLTK